MPTVLIAITLALLFWGANYISANSGDFHYQIYDEHDTFSALDDRNKGGPDPIKSGKKVFDANCSICHQASGLGTPGQFPPLAGSDWVQTEGPNRMIRIVLYGFTGPVTVSGLQFNNSMPALGPTLSDDQIANVLTFVRKNKEWGNSADEVQPEQVAAIRKLVGERGMWTEAEIKAVPLKN